MDIFRFHISGVVAEYEQLLAENNHLKASLQRLQTESPVLMCTNCACSKRVACSSSLEHQPKPVLATKRELFASIDFETGCLPPQRIRAEPCHKTMPAFPGVHHDAPHLPAFDIHAPPDDGPEIKVPHVTRVGLGDVKDNLRKLYMAEKRYDVKDFYKTVGFAQAVARHKVFEAVTMCVIVAYAIWIAIDADYNKANSAAESGPVFVVVEQLFTIYFFAELLFRFLAFKTKMNCFRDAWFMFDSLLVAMMVIDNWIMNLVVLVSDSPGSASSFLSNASSLRVVRLLRLTRLFRVARLLRALPELLILVKAMAAAARSVGFTLCLLLLVLYVFGIVFKQLLQDSAVGQRFFPSVLNSMSNLAMRGVLLDSPSELMNSLQKESLVAFFIMYLFIILASVSIMNMLVGILCEVITAVAAAEKETLQMNWVRMVLDQVMLLEIDSNKDGFISHEEFLTMLQSREAVMALREVGIDVYSLPDLIGVFFERTQRDDCSDSDDPESEDPKEKQLSFDEFIQLLYQLREGNTATVKDLITFQKWANVRFKEIEGLCRRMLQCRSNSPSLRVRKCCLTKDLTSTSLETSDEKLFLPKELHLPHEVPD